MSLLERLFSMPAVRKAIWRLWYPFLTRRLRDEEVLFLNYAFETDPPLSLKLEPADEPNRACIQLYHHLATQVELAGKCVLEVSCGHGGGASFLTRTLHPAHYTGLDLNPTGIAFCRRRHRVAGLDFVQGDAGNLPFADASLDRINCSLVLSYLGNPLELLREFHRVLRPGGRIVMSSMLPDTDMSKIYQRLLRRIETDPNLPLPPGMDRSTFADEMRHFLSAAAFLFMLAEEGQFAFFSREEMCNLAERAGFRRVESHLSFGEPAQAHITVGHR